ncbi:ABC transporter ATP-binding protein [Candidatus Saccharibacteria bacterium]|nr:ABC transporter ATP-binding protein [Candidatus Saccharibacteria bacterium]
MLRDHIKLIREYFGIAQISPLLFALNFITALLYKGLSVVRPFVIALIIEALTEGNAEKTYLYIFIYAIICLGYRFSLFINYKAYSWNVAHSYQALQSKIFDKLILIDHNFTKKISKGQLMNTINTDVFSIGEMVDEVAEYFTTLIQILAVLIISATYSPPIAVIMFASATLYVAVQDLADKHFNFYWWKTQHSEDKYSTFLGQTVSGLQEVRTFHMLPKLKHNLSKIQSNYNKSYKKQHYYEALRDGDIGLVYYIFQTLIYIILIWQMSTGRFQIDILIMICAYHADLIGYIGDFMDAVKEIRLTNASVRRVHTILNYKSDQEIRFGDLNLDKLKGSLTFKNVYFTLDRQKILSDINLKIRPHEFVAIVGTPGAGKTMLFNLILRLNRPTKGKIYLDNTEISEFSREVYTSNVAVANQSPFIFNMSIRKNLDFVDTDIKHQIEACKTAGIHDFIESLPQGYNTILRENATNISGGQKQMISIARTILTDAEVLLLDDISTSLDPDTAKLIPRLIRKLSGKRTIIMITKKPDLMKIADRIIVLDHGKISDSGTHEGLMKRSSVYRHLQNKLPSQEGGNNV